MTLAADTRAAIRRRPFCHEALRAGVLNYAAAARLLDVDGEESAIVAALRRYAATLPAYSESARDARVTMQSGLGERSTRNGGAESPDAAGDGGGNENEIESEIGIGIEKRGSGGDGGVELGDEPLVRVGGHAFVPGTGTLTGVLVTGDVDGSIASHVLGRLAVAGIDPVAAGVAGDTLAVVVSREEGPTALRTVESALDAVPE